MVLLYSTKADHLALYVKTVSTPGSPQPFLSYLLTFTFPATREPFTCGCQGSLQAKAMCFVTELWPFPVSVSHPMTVALQCKGIWALHSSHANVLHAGLSLTCPSGLLSPCSPMLSQSRRFMALSSSSNILCSERHVLEARISIFWPLLRPGKESTESYNKAHTDLFLRNSV